MDDGVKIRPMMKYVEKENKNKPMVGVEIGVRHGSYSKAMMDKLNIKTLYSVDPYKYYSDSGDRTWNRRFRSLNKALKIAKKILDPYIKSGQCVMLLKDSLTASKMLPDDFDFVYIDGCHLYDSVYADCEAWYKKVKSGGIIGGHDFNIMHSGVVMAVLDFCDDYNLELNLGNPEEEMTEKGDMGKMCDWWIVKK